MEKPKGRLYVASRLSQWIEAGSVHQFAQLVAQSLPHGGDPKAPRHEGSEDSEPQTVEVVVKPLNFILSNKGLVFHYSQLQRPYAITYTEENPHRPSPSLRESAERIEGEWKLRRDAEERTRLAEYRLEAEQGTVQGLMNIGSQLLSDSLGTPPLTPGLQEFEKAVAAERYTEQLILAGKNLQGYETAQVRLLELQEHMERFARRSIKIRPVYLLFGDPDAIEEVKETQGTPKVWEAPKPRPTSFHPLRRYSRL